MDVLERTPAIVRFRDTQIDMAHGAGGKASRRLIEGLIAPILSNPTLDALADAAVFRLNGSGVATTADAFVVKPLQFPGGSIGEIAVNGTLNDLAVSGARPVALMATVILEAGVAAETVVREFRAMAAAAHRSHVAIVGGDTKVVEHGMADGMYISTFGIGELDGRLRLSPERVSVGDRVLVSGPIGDHGITILLARGELDLEADLRSDTRAVGPFVEALAAAVGHGVHWMRDPTRGGVATALCELVRGKSYGIAINEETVPVRSEVRGACEILGLDPLHIANEGQFLAVVASERTDEALEALRGVPGGDGATLIGEVSASPAGTVLGVTGFGGTRAIDMLVGDPLPRIC